MIEFHIQTTAAHAEQLSDAMLMLGANAVSLIDAVDKPIYEPAPGEMPLWTNVVLIALLEDENLQPAVLQYLTSQQQFISNYHIKQVAVQDWTRTCLDQFVPQQFGKKLWICPSWHEPVDQNAVNVLLDPGLAFGTGTHATTQLCLQWLEQHILGQETMIDYGCGSGILAIAALKLGARHVTAVDHDPQALTACLDNLQRNHITPDQFTVCTPAQLDLSPVDLIVANIISQPLIELAPHFLQLLKPGGKIVLSGILQSQINEVLNCYQSYFTMQPKAVMQAEWARLEGIHHKDKAALKVDRL